jgi:hypothetical protein
MTAGVSSNLKSVQIVKVTFPSLADEVLVSSEQGSPLTTDPFFMVNMAEVERCAE